MSEPIRIPEEVLARQRDASNPALSAWVSANAGSGKTFVLAQRVIRLLLNGTDPGKILCLTFTKAAAANMATRVFDTLSAWTRLDDAALDGAIRALSSTRPDPILRARARRLFAQALDTPGGLKVQTIHAFCTQLLHQFPFEANVAARFTVLDDASQTQLLDRLTLAVLLDAAAKPDSLIGRALATAITLTGDQTFRDVVTETIGKRDVLTAWIARAGGVAAAAAELSRALGVDPDDSVAAAEAEFFSSSLIAGSEWVSVAQALEEGLKTDGEQADRFRRLGKASDAERLKTYLEIFCTAQLEPRRNIVTRAIRDRHPALFQRLVAEQGRVCGLLDRRRAVMTRDRTTALLGIAHDVIGRYQNEKTRRGLLDYDDLIDKTLDLLTRVDAAWVHYKLDLGIDHVLIDEAQDTSPRQWDIIARLVAEFASGEGARGSLARSIFAVGDDKQSIYSFQGAAPHRFAEMQSQFERRYRESGLGFLPIKFRYSFRSAPTILDAVDTVFGQPAAFDGLTADPVKTIHQAVRANAPGLVEIWDLVKPDERPAMEAWDTPFDTTSETNPRVKLARKIARSVRTWIARGDLVGDGAERHPVRPGDILILVRQRGPLFEAIISALKQENIAVAGADRLVLTEHIAVMDLMVLADALLLPDDDLALATALKSPLFGFDDAELFEIAWNRKGSLRAALRAMAAQSRRYAEAATRLDTLAATARRETPFAFYARVLGADGGRRRFLARLGYEAADALDEFLNLALDYESRETPSLQGFVAWLRTANADVKRDMEIARDEVRVMTVHGAKGLEAPVVILADTTSPPAGPPHRQPRLLTLPAIDAPPDTPDRLVWAARKDDDVGPLGGARQSAVKSAEDEYRRLLYVAMTRAADRLIVCGAEGERKSPDGCWYDLVRTALAPHACEEPADDGDGTVLRYHAGNLASSAATDTPSTAPIFVPPTWLARSAPPEAPRPTVISPSHADEAGTRTTLRSNRATATANADRRNALVRGSLVHRLMQSLPDIPRERRQEAARRHVERMDEMIPEAEREALLTTVLGLLDDSRFAPLFAPGSRAEVPIVGRVARPAGPPVLVSGQVDRLVVTDEAVLIADFKTNRPPPRRLEDVPAAYVTQLALYRAVLSRLYPGRTVRAALLWTEVPDIMDISTSALDRALARLNGV